MDRRDYHVSELYKESGPGPVPEVVVTTPSPRFKHRSLRVLVDRETRLPCNNCEEQHLLLALDVGLGLKSFDKPIFFWGEGNVLGTMIFHVIVTHIAVTYIDTTSGVVCGTSAWGSCESGRAVKFHLDWSESSGCKCIPPPLPKRLSMGHKILASKVIWYKYIYIYS